MFERGSKAKQVKAKSHPQDLGVTPAESQTKPQGGHTPPTAPLHAAEHEGTLIGEDVVIQGTISGTGHIVIQGRVKGNLEVHGDHITIGRNGRVEGEIKAREATISGRMDGKIAASASVHIARSADFRGEIKTGRISIDDGAIFNGKIEMDRDPGRQGGSTDMPADKIGEADGQIVEKLDVEPVKEGDA